MACRWGGAARVKKMTALDSTSDGAATTGDAVKPCACGAPVE
jgi:hypothetical protein